MRGNLQQVEVIVDLQIAAVGSMICLVCGINFVVSVDTIYEIYSDNHQLIQREQHEEEAYHSG